MVFDEEEDGGSYVQNKKTGEITKINEIQGDYQVDIWVPTNGQEVSEQTQLAQVQSGESVTCEPCCAGCNSTFTRLVNGC